MPSPHPKATFIIARNPDTASTLPFLVRVPIDGGLWFATRDSWPRASRLYCHPIDGAPPSLRQLELIEEAPVRYCAWRGVAIDLILARGANNRSQFVFTRARGRRMVFWQTQKAAQAARPGVRVPGSRLPVASMLVQIDTRERYPYRFAGRGLKTERAALRAGDYAVSDGGAIVAVVERKTLNDFAKGLSDGSLGFTMSHLATLPAAAVVVEGNYSRLLRHAYTPAGWLADLLARLQARYRAVPIAFVESRKLAEEWTARFLAAALAEARDNRLPLSQTLPQIKADRIRKARKRAAKAPVPDVEPLMTGAELLRRLRRRSHQSRPTDLD